MYGGFQGDDIGLFDRLRWIRPGGMKYVVQSKETKGGTRSLEWGNLTVKER